MRTLASSLGLSIHFSETSTESAVKILLFKADKFYDRHKKICWIPYKLMYFYLFVMYDYCSHLHILLLLQAAAKQQEVSATFRLKFYCLIYTGELQQNKVSLQ